MPLENGKVKVKSLSHVQLSVTLWTVTYQASPSMGFSRQEYWSGLPFPSPGDLPDPGIKPGSPALEADTLTSEPPGKEIESKYLTMHQTASNTELYDMKFSSYWSWKKQRFKKDVSYDMLPEPNPQKHWRSHFRFFLFSLSTYTWLDSDFYFRDHGLS